MHAKMAKYGDKEALRSKANTYAKRMLGKNKAQFNLLLFGQKSNML